MDDLYLRLLTEAEDPFAQWLAGLRFLSLEAYTREEAARTSRGERAYQRFMRGVADSSLELGDPQKGKGLEWSV